MIMILTYNETGWQEKSPKCQDGLEVLMSNARALETPKKKERTGKIVKWLHFVYVVYTSFLNLWSQENPVYTEFLNFFWAPVSSLL